MRTDPGIEEEPETVKESNCMWRDGALTGMSYVSKETSSWGQLETKKSNLNESRVMGNQK